jgi:hypothetical protein
LGPDLADNLQHVAGYIGKILKDANPAVLPVDDCFYESSDISHTANNATIMSIVLLDFELIPVCHLAGTAIPVRK